MLGVIRKRDVVLHPVVTVQSFGWRVFLRALTAGPGVTFLSLVAEEEWQDEMRRRVPDAIERAIALELRAMHIYEALAGRFVSEPRAYDLFRTLAVQERQHADLLRICHKQALRSPDAARCLAPHAASIPALEAAMDGAEALLGAEVDLGSALRLVLALESSEVNVVFDAIVEASPSEFVRKLEVFRTATRKHLTYIRAAVSRLDPALATECEKLAA